MEDLTNDQIFEALNANEELRGNFLEKFASNEHGKTFLDNYANTYFDEKVGAKIGEVHGMYDNDLKELGFEKPDGVKSYEFVKSTIKSLQEKAASGNPEVLEALKRENQELLGKIESGEGARMYKEQLEATKKAFEEETAKYQNQIAEFKASQTKNFITSDLQAALGSLEFNEALPKSVIDTMVKVKMEQLLANAKISDDNTVTYYDQNGEVILNRKNMIKATASDILKAELKDVIAIQRQQAGGGEKGGQNTKPTSFSNAKTQVELRGAIETNLLSDGYIKGSEDYQAKMDELFKEHRGDLPLR